MKLAKIVLGVGGLIMAGVGLAFVIDPGLLRPGGDFSLGGPAGATEIRAVYGGIELAIGVFLLLCFVMPTWRSPGLALAALVGLLAGAARVYGLVLGGIDWKNVLWANLEVAGGLVALYALARLRRERSKGAEEGGAPESGKPTESRDSAAK